MKVLAAAVLVIVLFGISGVAHLIGISGIEHDSSARVETGEQRQLSYMLTDWTMPVGGFAPEFAHLEGAGPWIDLVAQASAESGVPWQVLVAIMGIESGGNPQAHSPAGAVGLMQVMPQYWQETANQWGGDLWDPWVNIRTAAEILARGHAHWGSWEQSAAAYFGAIDETGAITVAADAFGTTGHVYVDKFTNHLLALGFVDFLFEDGLVTPEVRHSIDAAMLTLGTPYIWGGASYAHGGFDCSGLVTWAYSHSGIVLPRVAADQHVAATPIERNDLLPGDLIFFSGTTSDPGVTHVAIYLGKGYMINAPAEGLFVRVESLNTPFWMGHVEGFGRVIPQPEGYELAEGAAPKYPVDWIDAPKLPPVQSVDEFPTAPPFVPIEVPVVVEQPAEAPVEPQVEAPAEETPAETPAETPDSETPVEAPADQPSEEQPAEAPAEQPAEAPAEVPAEQPVETTPDPVIEEPVVEEPVVEEPVEEPSSEVQETAVEPEPEPEPVVIVPESADREQAEPETP